MARKALPLAIAAALAFAGCAAKGGRKEAKVKWTIDVACPCLLAPAVRRIIPRFREAHPRIGVWLDVKGQEGLLPGVLKGTLRPDLLLLVGDLEVESLRKRGLAHYIDTFCFVPLALVAPPGNPKHIEGLSDLAKPSVGRVGLGAEGTTLGRRAEELLKRAGVWERVRPKVVRARFQMELINLTRGGEYDAALAPASCVLAEGGKGAGLALVRSFARGRRQVLIPCMGVVLEGASEPKLAQIFLDFLVGKTAQKILKAEGFTPLSEARVEGG